MAQHSKCEFSLVRYMPDVVKGEFVNIGVLFRSHSEGGSDFADVRFTRDWRRVRCLNPAADIEVLESLETDLRMLLNAGAEGELILGRLEQYLSNSIELTPPAAVLSDAPAEEVDRLAEMYVEPRVTGKRELTGRQAIRGLMQSAFRRTGVWDLLFKDISIARYTDADDPLKIDCGYRPNGIVKLIHAVSVQTSVEPARILALTYPEIQAGIQRLENASSELTAIVETLDRSDSETRFALKKMESAGIVLATTESLPEIAEKIRIDMHA